MSVLDDLHDAVFNVIGARYYSYKEAPWPIRVADTIAMFLMFIVFLGLFALYETYQILSFVKACWKESKKQNSIESNSQGSSN